MILNYKFEQKNYRYEITDIELAQYACHFDSADITNLLSETMNGLSSGAKKQMQRAIGAETKSDIAKMSRDHEKRAALNDYVIANCDKFVDSIRTYFRHEAHRSFDNYMIHSLMY